MSPNTAPIKYAQRMDSLYLTIALAGALRNRCCVVSWISYRLFGKGRRRRTFQSMPSGFSISEN
jgi:hypothetical protein